MACSNWARWMPTATAWARVDFELGLRLRHRAAGADAPLVLVLGDPERLLVGGGGIVQELPLLVQCAELEVVGGELGLGR